MKKIFAFLFIALMALPLSAQRFGYVDTDFILENLPQYVNAQQRLKTQTDQWNQEIQNRQETLQKKQNDFLNEKVLLTDDQIKKEQAEIDEETQSIKQLQEKRYGQEGDLIKLRKTLVKPIQDQVWIAVKEIAEKRNYGFIFDKGSDLIMVYTDPKFDISREVLLQLNPNAVIKDKSTGNKSNTKGSGGKGSKSNTATPRNNSPSSKGKSPTNAETKAGKSLSK